MLNSFKQNDPEHTVRDDVTFKEREALIQNLTRKRKISEISGPKLNGTVKIPGKVFENLGIRFESTLFDGISGIIENFVFHSQEISGLVSLPSVN